jgi:hypothetical protein
MIGILVPPALLHQLARLSTADWMLKWRRLHGAGTGKRRTIAGQLITLDEHDEFQRRKDSTLSIDEHEAKPNEQRSPAGENHSHAWYDDDFCSGGGMFVGEGKPQVVCPVCGETMDVDEDGNLFKHRPRIPKSNG